MQVKDKDQSILGSQLLYYVPPRLRQRLIWNCFPGVPGNTSMKDYTCTFPIFPFTSPPSFIEYVIAYPKEFIVLLILDKCCLVKFPRQHNDDTVCLGGHGEITLFPQNNKK